MQGKKFNLFGPAPTRDEARQSLSDAFGAFAVARRTLTMGDCQDFIASYADDTTSDLGLGGKGFVKSMAEVIDGGLAKVALRGPKPTAFHDLDDDVSAAKDLLREKASRSLDGSIGGCTSYVQRMLKIGYSRGAAILEKLEQENFITVPDKLGNRRLITTS